MSRTLVAGTVVLALVAVLCAGSAGAASATDAGNGGAPAAVDPDPDCGGTGGGAIYLTDSGL